MTHLSQLDQFPPFLCWLLARRNRRPIQQAEISQRTGWGMTKVARFCRLTTWARVVVADVDAFREACGITVENEWRHREYLKRTTDLSVTTSGLSHHRRRPWKAQQLSRKLLSGGDRE